MEMDNFLLQVEEALQEDLNLNVLVGAVEQLIEPLHIIPNPRETPTRNENYYEEVIPHYTPDDFWCHFRMTRRTFELLLNMLQNRRQVIQEHVPFDKKLLFAIWILAKPESFIAAGDRFNLAPGTGHMIFFEIVQQVAELRFEIIVWPDGNDREKTARNLYNKSNIPGVIGAIDGCHIAIKAPPHNPIDYYNRNNYHSVILQAVCNDKKEFIDVFAGTPGRVHDSRVFRTSPLYTILTENEAVILPTEHLLGDSAYPLLPFLLTPYRDNGHLTAAQVTYNTTMSSVRSVIEQAFGLLKGKFRRLKYLDMTRIDMIPVVIIAACILHNIILRNDGIAYEEILDEEPNGPMENVNIDVEINRERNTLGERKRAYITALLLGN